MNLLLASTSRLHGGAYLDYLENELPSFFGHGARIVFIPYARPGGISWDEYTAIAQTKFNELGFPMQGMHQFSSPLEALKWADGIFTGGGNTFVLLKTLQDLGVLNSLREMVHGGLPYMGSSAGSNLAGLTVGTTNDMPIVHPRDFRALEAVPFNLNPHYLDPIPNSTHMGETREMRIKEFHHFNDQPVLGLREGSWIRRLKDSLSLGGNFSARLFQKNTEPQELNPGPLDFVSL